MLRRRDKGELDQGVTLVETLVGITTLGVIISTTALTLVSAMKINANTVSDVQNSAQYRSDLGDASLYFPRDVQGANTMAVTNSGGTTRRCQVSPDQSSVETLVIDILGQSAPAGTAINTTVVSYVRRTVGSGASASQELHRLACVTSGTSPVYPLTAQTDITIADGLAASPAVPVTVACSSPSSDCTTATQATMTITSSKLAFSQPITGLRRTS